MIISPRLGDIAALTGLRDVAALLVVVDHFASWNRVTAEPNPAFERFAMISGIGMAIFFTVSGYVIALSYSHWNWRERRRHPSPACEEEPIGREFAPIELWGKQT